MCNINIDQRKIYNIRNIIKTEYISQFAIWLIEPNLHRKVITVQPIRNQKYIITIFVHGAK
jgi:hypothetical protein